MNQQEFFSRGGYANLNLAPPNTRQSYNTATGVPGAGSMRLGPRPLDASQYAGHFPYLDDRFNSYSDVRHSRMQSPQAYGDSLHANSFVTSNAQAWQHNSGATTINGAMDAGRSRNAGRPPLPTVRTCFLHSPTHSPISYGFAHAGHAQEWFTVPEPNLGSQNPYTTAQYALPGHYSQSMGPMNGGLLNSGPLNGGPSLGSSDRSVYATGLERQATPKSLAPDLIPTAIVIKNIPFNVRKETLAMLMQELNLPTPYAFNYHFDNGIFRGLAFANFQNPEDTWQVIDALNGFDVSGRKLRVEYKKMLPEAERERIEREKREKRGQLEEQHQPLKLSHQTSMHQLQPTPHPPSAAARSDAIRESPTCRSALPTFGNLC